MKFKGNIWYTLLLGLIVASVVLAGCGATTEPETPEAPKATEATAEPTEEPPEDAPTIAFSGFSSTNEFWLTLARAAEARAGELGVNFVNVTTEVQDAEAQKAAVDTAITQGVDAIIVGAADSRGWDDSFNKAQEAGIPIITVDTGIEHPHVSTLIQTDNLIAARAAGDYIVEQTGGEGKVLVIGGSVGHQTGDARKQGVEEQTAAAGMEVIGDWSDWDENKSAEITQNVLSANPDVVAVFVAFDPGAVAALSVIRDKGLLDQITLVGFDGLPVALKAIKAGEMEASMAQDPARMGSEGVDLALKVINGEEVPDFIPIDGVLITADNVDEFLTEEEGGEEAPSGKAPEDVTIAFSGFSSTNEFWLTLARAAEAKAEELGVNFVNVTTEVQDAEAQKAAVDTAITQGVDAIIVGAADSRGWDDSFNKAQEAGIPIITVDTGIEHPHVSTLIQTDNLAAARGAGDYIVEQTGGEGKVLVIGGSVGHQTGDARKQGVEEQTAAAGMEVIGDWSDWDENKSAEITQNVLSANPDVVAVFVAFDPGAVAALSVIRDKGLLDQITLVGFDGLPVALKAIKAGEMEASMAQNPARMGAEGLELAVKVVQGQEVPKFIPIDGVLITADNVDEFLTE
jgi:ABC-type sugar transport system substrate-binding protein